MQERELQTSKKEWKDSFAPKYKEILMNLNKGGILTFEMVRQCIMSDGVMPSKEDTTKSQTFVGVWEQIIHELRTDDGGHVLPQQRATNAHSNHSEKFSEPI